MHSPYFRKQIFLPQDHGSWVFILSPLLIGLFAGGRFTPASLYLVIACMAAFLIRQPVTIAVKAYSGRRARADLPAARLWVAVYGSIALLALIAFVRAGFGYLLYLAIPGAPVFAWHLWLVSRREERKQAAVEIIATGVLSLAAPAAYWVGLGRYDPAGWWLWILVWFQTAASIVYAYLRLEQRSLPDSSLSGATSDPEPVEGRGAQSKGIAQSKASFDYRLHSEPSARHSQSPGAIPGGRSNLWRMGYRAALYTSFNLAAALTLGLVSVLPRYIFIPYLVQWSETMWGIFHPAIGWKPTRVGIRQLIVSTLWTVLFIVTWRL